MATNTSADEKPICRTRREVCTAKTRKDMRESSRKTSVQSRLKQKIRPYVPLHSEIRPQGAYQLDSKQVEDRDSLHSDRNMSTVYAACRQHASEIGMTRSRCPMHTVGSAVCSAHYTLASQNRMQYSIIVLERLECRLISGCSSKTNNNYLYCCCFRGKTNKPFVD